MKTNKLLIGTLILMILLFCTNYFLFNGEHEISLARATFQSVFSGLIFFVIMYLTSKNNK
ncbi:hypothetical protein AB670_03454 [Chryseobacterium sp. MOF25P]|nr:hypothetical protein AB670_03454 [Chryseobacterium sp. MOF25P]OBW43720.1 hypothetical protein AB671_04197 [Chryseobacterium sp. BGARF1]